LNALEISHSSTWFGMFSRRLDWINVKMTAECLMRLPVTWRDFWRLYRSYRPDIVYFANHHEIILLWPLLVWIRRKVVCHMHDPPPAIGFQKVSFFLWRRGVGRFLFISHSARERLTALGPIGAADIVVHNGVHVSPLVMPRRRVDRFCRRFGWPDDSIIVGISGQINFHKGQEDFIAAADIARTKNPNLRFVIGGRGPDDFIAKLGEHIAARSLETYVQFSGWLANVAEFYEAVDVFVLASRHEEGFGLVVAEAGERGLPVIATRSGGALEVVVDEVTGILVDKQAPRDLADAMIRLANDEQLREQMGRNARERMLSEFDLAVQVDRVARFFEKIGRENNPLIG
jgi:glycosyltransferase involved in cell wall biosynthesis